MKKITHLIVIAVAVTLSSCQPEQLQVEEYSPVAAVPLVHSTLDVYDILDRSDSLEELGVDEDGLVFLHYSGDLFSLEIPELVSLGDIEYLTAAQLSAGDASNIDAGADYSFPLNVSFPFEVEMETNELRVDSIELNAGLLSLEIGLLQDEIVGGQIQIPGLIDGSGQPLQFNLNHSDFINGNWEMNVPLAGYSIRPEFAAPIDNSLSLTGEVSLSDNPNHTATAGDFLQVELYLNDLGFERIWGYFGQLDLNTDLDSVTVSIFENAIEGSFQLTEASINLITTNSFGIPADISFENINSINLNSGVVTPMIIEEDFAIEGMQSPWGEAEAAVFTIDQDNSNITDFLDPAPKSLLFQMMASGNPEGEPVAPETNFISADSRLDVDIDVNLPMKGYGQDIVLVDTLDAEIDFDTFDEVDSLELKVFSSNGFPVDADIQLEFLDENDEAIEFLFEGGSESLNTFLLSGMMNGPLVVAPTQHTFVRTIDSEGADNLNRTRKIVIRSVLNTYESQSGYEVHFREEYELEVKLGVKIFGNIEL